MHLGRSTGRESLVIGAILVTLVGLSMYWRLQCSEWGRGTFIAEHVEAFTAASLRAEIEHLSVQNCQTSF